MKRQQTPRPAWEETMYAGHGADTARYTRNETQPTILYFAYGSNLKREQMKRRCPDSVPVQTLTLHGYRLVFKGAADIVEDKDTYVVGAVYRISIRDRVNLDKHEGFRQRDPRGGSYRTEWFYMNSGTGKRTDSRDASALPVLVYRKNSKIENAPTTEYWNRVKAGYEDWNLPTDTLLEARRRAPVVKPLPRVHYQDFSPKGSVIRSTDDGERNLIGGNDPYQDDAWFQRMGITDPYARQEADDQADALNEWEQEQEDLAEQDDEDEPDTLSNEDYTHLCGYCNRMGYEEKCWYCLGTATFID